MHGWVLDLIRLWASNFRCDSAGKINSAEDDRLSRLPIIQIRRAGGGSLCPRASRGHSRSPEQSEQLSRAKSAFPCVYLFSLISLTYSVSFLAFMLFFRASNGNYPSTLSFLESSCCYSMFVSCSPPIV